MSSVRSDESNGRRAWQRAGLRCLLVTMTLGLGAGHEFGFANPAGDEPITAGTYNVRVAVLPAAIDIWVNTRRHQVFQSIEAKQPDFMGFQEAYARTTGTAGVTQQEALGQLFVGTQWQFFSWEAQNEFNMNPIIVNTDRFTPVASGTVTVNFIDFLGPAGWDDYHDLHEFFHGNGMGGFVHFLGPERYVNWVVADDLVSGTRVAFLTSHYETFIGQNNHGAQFDALFQVFSDLVNSSFGYASGEIHAQAEVLRNIYGDLGVIIGGDFETPDPSLPSQQVYADAGYEETWRYIHGNGLRPTMGIDNMFAMLDDFAIDDSYYDQASYTNGASDHKPLYADVTPNTCGSTSNFCTSAANSAGSGALISSSGSTSIGANDMSLTASAGVPSQFGLFYYGPMATSVVFGDGFRCVDGASFRLNPPEIADAFGESTRVIDFNAAPMNSGPGMITAGSTWYFQYWYRDPSGPGGTGFNLSDGLEVTFCP